MPTRTIKTADGTEHSGNRSAFTDYEEYVEYKHWFTQTKIYKSMIIYDCVATTLTDIVVKTVWLITLLITSFLLSSWVIISSEGTENLRAEVMSSPSPSTSSGHTSSGNTRLGNTRSGKTEKPERLDNGSEVMPNEGEDKDRVNSEPSNKGENELSLTFTLRILPVEKPEPSNKGEKKLGLKSTRGILGLEPFNVITPKSSIHTFFQRELQTLLDQSFIDPFTHYILQYQGDKNRAWYVQQAKTERENRCAKIEQNFQRRPKNCKYLAWLKRGYNFSCPQVVVKFAQNISCIAFPD